MHVRRDLGKTVGVLWNSTATLIPTHSESDDQLGVAASAIAAESILASVPSREGTRKSERLPRTRI